MDASSPGSSRGYLLIVEDDAALRLLLRELLSRDGYQVLTAADGRLGQEILSARDDVDVVVTDLLMPRMSGLELMRWAQEARPGPVWLIFSGLETFEAAAQAVELGVFTYLPKPVDGSMSALRFAVARAFAHRAILKDRARLTGELADSNRALREKVDQLSNLCGLLNQQASIIEQDLTRARQIQRALLPSEVPTLPGIAINAVYRPCRHVGGDLYNVVTAPNGQLIFYVADAAGHGVSAAMLSVLFKHRICLMDDQGCPHPPALVLAEVNRALSDECHAQGVFVTCAYGVLDPASGEVALAAAGHPPVVFHHSDGDVELIEHTGPAIGLSSEEGFAEEHLWLAPGDRLFLYTDGLLAGQDGQTPLNAVDLGRRFANLGMSGQDALELCLDDILGQVNAVTDEPDDVTMLLLTVGDGESFFDNGESDHRSIRTPLPTINTAEILRGGVGGATVVCVRGRATWTHAQVLLDTCVDAVEGGSPLTLDLSRSSYLDSTILGTIHEVVTRANQAGVPIHVLEVQPEVRDLFSELSMTCVLERMAPATGPGPKRLRTVRPSGHLDVDATRERVIEAHLALAELSDTKRDEFMSVVELLRCEMAEDAAEASAADATSDSPD